MPATPESSILEHMLNLVRERFGPEYRLLRVVCEVGGPDGIRQELVIAPPAGAPAGQPVSQPVSVEDRPETERAILEALGRAERPLKGRAVANRAGKQFNSHFREVLSRLHAGGVLTILDGGYWLTGRPLPDRQDA